MYTEYGNVKKIITDNGAPFNSEEFRKYLKFMGIEHRRITPEWP